MSTVTVDDVQEALTNVIDPGTGLDFVELGLIYGSRSRVATSSSASATLARLPDLAAAAEQMEVRRGLDGVAPAIRRCPSRRPGRRT